MVNDISKDIKVKILEQEIATYKNTLYLWGVRARTAKNILKDKALEQQAIEESVKCQLVLDSLNEELKEIDK